MGRRVRHFNPGHAGASLVLDSRFISGLSNGAGVSTWVDRSGNGNDATQGTSGEQPSFETSNINGQPAIKFDGTDDRMAGTNSIWTGNSYRSLIVVYKPGNASMLGAVFGQFGNPQSTARWFGIYCRNDVVTGDPYVAVYADDLEGPTVTLDAKIATATFNGVLASYKNGVFFDSKSITLNTNTTPYALGQSYAGPDYFNGSICYITTFNSMLTNSMRFRVEQATALTFKVQWK